jgi:hypothetical protein
MAVEGEVVGTSGGEAKRRPERVFLLLGLLWLGLAVAIVVTQLATPPKIEIRWVTETEFETAGFNIYRSEAADGGFVQINETLIASAADPAAGASYSFTDGAVEAGKTYYYRLEDVEYDSSRQQHEILSREVPRIETWAVALAAGCALVGLFLLGKEWRRRET